VRAAVVIAASLAVAACSGAGDSAEPAETTAVAVPSTSTGTTTDDVASTPAPAAAPTSTAPEAPESTAPTTRAEPSPAAEVGVPGLDSDDAFCAAWSRWAGTYQVLLVSNAFGSSGPEALATLEVVAAPVLVAAAGAMVAAWPAEIAAERDVAEDGLLGPITRRLVVAREALVAAGADDAALGEIELAWLTALAARDPSTPDFVVELPDEIWTLVDTAAEDYASRLAPFAVDPSLTTDVETPLTLDYLAAECPDQGALSGQEIDPDATAP
jgi:hypothetical protein